MLASDNSILGVIIGQFTVI